MKKRVIAVFLAALLGTALAAPASAAADSPQALLKTVAYYGDPGQCAMTAAQAQAYAQVIQGEIANMKQARAQADWIEGDGALRCYAALVDAGGGNPVLLFAGGWVPEWSEWSDSGCDWGEVGWVSLWQYQGGQTVALPGDWTSGEVRFCDSYLLTTDYGEYYGAQVRPFVNGAISIQPSTTAQWWVENDDGTQTGPQIYKIDGNSATQAQFDAWRAQWDRSEEVRAGHAYYGGVGGIVWGCCPAERMLAALNDYAGAVRPTAHPSTQNVLVDGKTVEFPCYALKDANGNDTNYIKLRDVAQILNGTPAQFEVSWDGAVNIVTGAPYTPNGTELSTPFSGSRTYTVPTSETRVNGAAADLDAIVLTDDAGNGYTYYKLRDLGSALGFTVDWSADKGIFIETK